MASEDQLVKEINDLKNQLGQVKQASNTMKARRMALSSEPVIRKGAGLQGILRSFLPKEMVPKNVGHKNHVAWPFYYQVDFDLSETTDWPDLNSGTRQTRSFQVSQEAAFLITAVSRHANDYSDAGDLGPLNIEFRDRQSSRFFNNEPIPIQMIGQKGYYTYIPVPMLVMPNAFMDVIMATSLDDGVTQNTPGSATGIHQFTFHGYRVRVEDAKKVLSSIFG